METELDKINDDVIADIETYAEFPAYQCHPIAFGNRQSHLIHDVFTRPIPGAFGVNFLRRLIANEQ